MKIVGKQKLAFELGWSQVPRSQTHTVKSQIMKALGITSKASFYFRLHGKTEPSVTEARQIERIFNALNITKIWGNAKRS